MEHLSLPVLDTRETNVVAHEVLEVERLTEGFRLLHSPAFVWGIAAGDIIELDPAELAGFRVRSRAGNVAIVVALGDLDKGSAPVQRLITEVERLGGCCEGGPGSSLVFTVPVRAGFRQLESVFDGFRNQGDGVSWWYGNVYDRHDRPLGWWAEAPSG